MKQSDSDEKEEREEKNVIKDLDVFRRNYPQYVKDTAMCFRKMFRFPKKWRIILKHFKVPKKKVRKMLGTDAVNTKNILFIKNRYYHEDKVKPTKSKNHDRKRSSGVKRTNRKRQIRD